MQVIEQSCADGYSQTFRFLFMSQTSIFAGSLFNPIIRRGSFFAAKCLGLSDGEEDEDEEDDERLLLFALDDDEVKSFFKEDFMFVFSLT